MNNCSIILKRSPDSEILSFVNPIDNSVKWIVTQTLNISGIVDLQKHIWDVARIQQQSEIVKYLIIFIASFMLSKNFSQLIQGNEHG